MLIKNITEDLVLDTIEEVLKEFNNKLYESQEFRDDLACYVLNRMPPRYLQSNRGVIHEELTFQNNVQLQADVYNLVIEGARILPGRRKDSIYDGVAYKEKQQIFEEQTEEYFFNFPYFMGRILSSITLSHIPDVKVSLYILNSGNYVLAPMINQKWNNPTSTVDQTIGYYAFWVQPVKDSNNKETQKNFDFKVIYEHQKFDTIEKKFFIELTSEQKIISKIRRGFIYRIADRFVDITG